MHTHVFLCVHTWWTSRQTYPGFVCVAAFSVECHRSICYLVPSSSCIPFSSPILTLSFTTFALLFSSMIMYSSQDCLTCTTWWEKNPIMLAFCCCAKTPWPRQLTRQWVYLDLQFWRLGICHVGEVWQQVSAARMLRAHFFHHKHQAEGTHWKLAGPFAPKACTQCVLPQAQGTTKILRSSTNWGASVQVSEFVGDVVIRTTTPTMNHVRHTFFLSLLKEQ